MSFFDQFSKVTKDFGNKAQEMTKDIKGKIEEQQAIARLKAQINEVENQKKNTYIAIGELYYNQHKDEPENEMESQFKIIADAEKRIAQYELQLKTIKNENTCPKCGAAISNEALFCPNCGTKVEKVQPEPQTEESAEDAMDTEKGVSKEEFESIKMEEELESDDKSAKAEKATDSEENPADK